MRRGGIIECSVLCIPIPASVPSYVEISVAKDGDQNVKSF